MDKIYEVEQVIELIEDFTQKAQNNESLLDFSIQTEDRYIITTINDIEPYEIKSDIEGLDIHDFYIPLGWYGSESEFWAATLKNDCLEIRHPHFNNLVYVIEAAKIS